MTKTNKPSRKLDALLVYNALDCVRTAAVWQKQARELRYETPDDAPRREKLYAQQKRLAEVAGRMSYFGFPVDEIARKRLSRELTALFEARKFELYNLIRPHESITGAFRISSKGGVNEHDLAALIFKESAKPGIRSFEMEVPMSDSSRTETGRPAVNRRALLYLMAAGNCPEELKRIIRLGWQVDAPLKARSTYIESEKVQTAIGADGRLHARVNSCGAETGRWSCAEPNLFNLSEEKDEDAGSLQGDLPNVRKMYRAPKGMAIVHRDFSQLELQIMAEYTGDVLLKKMLATGDPHTARVYEWFGVKPGEPVPKMIRRQGKVVGFASQYSAGADTAWLTCLEQVPDIEFGTVETLWRTFREKHVGIVEHWNRSLSFANARGYNETAIMHRRRYYPPQAPPAATDTSNYAIQGTAADVANCVMAGEWETSNTIQKMLDKHFPEAWLAMHVYDSFDVICYKKHAKGVDSMLNDVMRGPWEIVPGKKIELPSDGKIGESWGDV